MVASRAVLSERDQWVLADFRGTSRETGYFRGADERPGSASEELDLGSQPLPFYRESKHVRLRRL